MFTMMNRLYLKQIPKKKKNWKVIDIFIKKKVHHVHDDEQTVLEKKTKKKKNHRETETDYRKSNTKIHYVKPQYETTQTMSQLAKTSRNKQSSQHP